MQKYWLFFSNNIYLSKCPKAWWEKKWRGRANFGRIKFSSSLFASKMSATYKPVTLNCSCWRHIINILLTELSRSVWENLDLGRVYRPHCVRSVLTTSVKILPYRPPARLIRAKYWLIGRFGAFTILKRRTMNVKLRSVHTVKKCFSILSIWNEEYSLYFALYGIHDFRTLNTELRTAKSKRSKKALLRSHALRTKYDNGVLPGDLLCRFALWSIHDFRTRIVRRLWTVLFRNVKSFLGLSRFENKEYSLCFALWGTIIGRRIFGWCDCEEY